MDDDSELFGALYDRDAAGPAGPAGDIAERDPPSARPRSSRLKEAADAARRAESSRIASLRAAELSRAIEPGDAPAADAANGRRTTASQGPRRSRHVPAVSAVSPGLLRPPSWASPVSRAVPSMGGGASSPSASSARSRGASLFASQYGHASVPGSPSVSAGRSAPSPALVDARREEARMSAALSERGTAALSRELQAAREALARERASAAEEARRGAEVESRLRREVLESRGRVAQLEAEVAAAREEAAVSRRRADKALEDAAARAAAAEEEAEEAGRRAERAEEQAARLGGACERLRGDVVAAVEGASAARRRAEAAVAEAEASREARQAAEAGERAARAEVSRSEKEVSVLRTAEAQVVTSLRREVRQLTSSEQRWRGAAARAEEEAAAARAGSGGGAGIASSWRGGAVTEALHGDAAGSRSPGSVGRRSEGGRLDDGSAIRALMGLRQ